MTPPKLTWQAEDLGQGNSRHSAKAAGELLVVVQQIRPPTGGKGIAVTITRDGEELFRKSGWDAVNWAKTSAEAAAAIIATDHAEQAAEQAAAARQLPPTLADFQAHGE